MRRTREQLQTSLRGFIATLKADELEVLFTVAQGLVKGREVYGTLRVTTDNRDFGAEALEEVRDALVYVGAKLVRYQHGQ